MKWKYTHIEHAFRKAKGLSLNEYAIFDFIYRSSTHPAFARSGGWSDIPYSEIAAALDLSKGTISNAVTAGEVWGLIEKHENGRWRRTLPDWYNYAYLDELPEDAEIVSVQKLNVQKLNDSVQKLNDDRSENERKRSENERHYNNNSNSGNNELSEKGVFEQDAVRLVELLNELTGSDFSRATVGKGSKNVTWLCALLRKGYTAKDLENMIIYKVWDWNDNPKMKRYLRPVTLFKNHPEEYLEEAAIAAKDPEFVAVIQAAKDSERRKVGFAAGANTARAAQELSNW